MRTWFTATLLTRLIMKLVRFLCLSALLLITNPAYAESWCSNMAKPCLSNRLEQIAPQVTNEKWRNSLYKDLAVIYVRDNHFDKALQQLRKISVPDTQAMTVRSMGMAFAKQKPPATPEQKTAFFDSLKKATENIKHPPSHEIAHTYIAMAQALAGEENASNETAKNMENQALRNKAFAESSEIFAKKGHFETAFRTITYIDTQSFRNKALKIIADIALKDHLYNHALKAGQKIENTWLQAQTIKNILNDMQKHKK